MEKKVLDKESLEEVLCDELGQRDQRSVILNILYAVESFDYKTSLESVIKNIAGSSGSIIKKDGKIFGALKEIIEKRQELDAEVEPLFAHWTSERIGVITRLVFRYAIWELKYTDTPHSVVINEAVELAKCFGEKDSYKFVNGVLDEWRKKQQN